MLPRETRQLPVTAINDAHCMNVAKTEKSLLGDRSHSETVLLKDETPENIIRYLK